MGRAYALPEAVKESFRVEVQFARGASLQVGIVGHLEGWSYGLCAV